MLLTSNNPYIIWPAITGEWESRLLALLHQLEQSQWWTTEQIEQAQREQLERLLSHASETVAFYRQRFGDRRPGELLDAWDELPILTRREVRSLGAQLNSTEPPKELGKTYPIQSSGSTGQPIKVRWSEVNRLIWMAFTAREHLWHQRNPQGKFVAIRPDRKFVKQKGIERPNWGPPVGSLFSTGPSALLNSRIDVKEQLQWLQGQNPTYLLSLPSNIQALLETAQAEGIKPPGLKEVRSFGETLEPQVRELCRQVWDVQVVDMYSAQEVGHIALQCPTGEHYHIQSEGVLVEVLDDQGRQCEPGEVGRIVVTPLHHFATPLIRYEIGDYAEVGEPCACGRGLPVIRRILGRQRNMALSPDGKRFWPSFPAEIWSHISAINNIQLVQKKRDYIELRYVSDSELGSDEQRELVAGFQKSLGYPFMFGFTRLDAVPRHPNGKYEDFICEVD